MSEIERTKCLIDAALEEDKKCRYPGVTGGLYTLDQLGTFSRLGHGVPTIRVRNRGSDFSRASDDDQFRARLHKRAPWLESFDMAKHGVCLAGGAVSGILMKYGGHTHYSDFDLFLVGHKTDDDARAALEAVRTHLAAEWKGETWVHRTTGCITFTTHETCTGAHAVVQVILRRYSTLAEVPHGFDLGSSAVVWDGKRVYTTALGKIALEHGANVLNLATRRGSYERRLARYFERGFDLVLPELSGCGLISLCGDLPYLHLGCIRSEEGCACHLSVGWMSAAHPGAERPAGDEPLPVADSDYGLYSDYDSCAVNNTLRNARILGREVVRVEGLKAMVVLTSGLDITQIQPVVLAAPLLTYLSELNFKRVDIDKLISTLGAELAETVIAVRFHAWKRVRASGVKHDAASYQEAIREIERITIKAVAAQRAVQLSDRAIIPFAFMTVEDKTALTGPFPRALVTAEEWYGAAKKL